MNNYFDLEKELSSVIEEFGEHEGYVTPSIRWSDNMYWGTFGEYRYCKNEIIVSKALDSSVTRPEFLRHIVFHEYTHQLFAEHDKKFQREMNRFPGYEKIDEMWDEFVARVGDPPLAMPSLPPIDRTKPVLFCRLPYSKEAPESYYSDVFYINHNNAGLLYGRIPEKYCRERVPQVIWVVEEDGVLYLVGTARNVQLYPDMQTIHDKELFREGSEDARFQFHCKQGDNLFTFPESRMVILADEETPSNFYSDNVFTSDDIPEGIYREILGCYEKFDRNTHRIGMDECEIDTQVQVFKTNDIDELHENACRETSRYRKIWILNKCLAMKQDYRLYKDLAATFDAASIFDKAIENYEKALEYRNQSSVRARIEKIRSMIPEYEKYGLWID